MKKPVLILLALLSLIPCAQAMAQTPTAVPPANPAVARIGIGGDDDLSDTDLLTSP